MVRAARLRAGRIAGIRRTTGRAGQRRNPGGSSTAQAPRWRVLAVFLLPALLLYTTFIIYPMLSALQYSAFTWKGTAQEGFAGLSNFIGLFTSYPFTEKMYAAFAHTVVFFAGTMVVQNATGLGFAVLLHRLRAAKRFFQTLYTLPYMVSPLVVGYLWTLLLSPVYGPVNWLFEAVGLDFLSRPWLGDPNTALGAAILMNAWQWVGFPTLLFGAALAGIPEEYAEAARVDGASAWTTFRRITLPLLVPAIGTVTILTFVGNFNLFELIYAVGGSTGSPAGSTDVLGLLFYRTAFEGGVNAIGRSSALAVLMFVFIFGVSILANRWLRRREVHT